MKKLFGSLALACALMLCQVLPALADESYASDESLNPSIDEPAATSSENDQENTPASLPDAGSSYTDEDDGDSELSAQADATYTSGDWTYTVTSGKATITHYDGSTGTGVTVTIPSNIGGYTVTKLADNWLGNNDSQHLGTYTPLAKVIIPDSVTELASGCFNLTGVADVEIGAGVKTIGYYAFVDDTSLAAINVSASNPNFTSVDGVLFNKDKTTLLQCPQTKTGTYSIPSTVTKVNELAFMYTEHSKVTIPSSVTEMGQNCFARSEITSIEIPSSVTKMGYDLCSECTELTSVTVNASADTIDGYSFSDCPKLTSVKLSSNIHFLGNGAFRNDSALDITLPNTIVGLGAYCLTGCKSSKLPAGMTQVGDYSFRAIDQKVTATEDYAQAWKVLDLVNKQRAANGLSALTMDKGLLDTAMQRAAEITTYFSHTRPCSLSCFTAFETTGATSYAENIASYYGDANSVMNGWMNSSGHKANILGSGYTRIGIGVVKLNGSYYWVQDFVGGGTTSTVSRRSDTPSKTFDVYKNFDHFNGTDSDTPFTYNLTDATITLDPTTAKYTGSALTPKISATYQGINLIEGFDYKKSYTNNVDFGTATATISSGASKKAKTAGSGSASFEIYGKMERLWGATALDTMGQIVDEAGFSQGGTVVIATNDGYWDALTASGLAGISGAPVLLTNGQSLSAQTKAQIKKLAPKQVFICGGTAAISNGVKNEVASITGVTPVRLAGNTAVDTAVKVFEQGKKSGTWQDTAFVATSNGYWDALGISPYAYAAKCPIFLTNQDGTLSQSVLSAMKAGGITKVYLLGGTAAIPDSVRRQISGASMTTAGRLGGTNAVATSAVIAKWELNHGMSCDKMAVATNDGYWDSLTGAALCGKNHAVLILASDSDRYAIDQIAGPNKSSISAGYIFGGQAAVSSGTARYLENKVK